jgi:hypothetical protein
MKRALRGKGVPPVFSQLAGHIVVVCLSLVLLINSTQPAIACGPSYIEPIFVFKESPDLPFSDFTAGKIGIVQPTFGRKTLVIAYRYLNGGSFSADEQKELITALSGAPPEEDDNQALKAWIAARKELLSNEGKLPEIYAERKNAGYDFFPNCASNAFEVATETLKDRVARYGADDPNVRAWIAAQDAVFQNCSGGATIPSEPNGSPTWLRQDRQYQIAAAHFYSLNFDAARAKFEEIAGDNESPWQATADYLVARTLVRQASLTENEAAQRSLYERAELRLQTLLGKNSSFNRAEQRLLGLIKYRIHPEERLGELAHVLADQSGNYNVKQDLIDYVWLFDKFQAQAIEEEQKREEAANVSGNTQGSDPPRLNEAQQKRYTAIQKGELIEMWLYPRTGDGQVDYSQRHEIDFKYGVSETDVQQAYEIKFGRKLTPDEIKDLKERYDEAQSHREWLLSPNRKWSRSTSDYEGCAYNCGGIALNKLPGFMRTDDLSDWILTLQTTDTAAYAHAFRKWRETESPAWLMAALTRADRSSRQLARLIRAGEKVQPNEAVFPTIAYHLIRLQTATGKTLAARQLLDEIIGWEPGVLPVSARNQFLEQRLQLAVSLTEFLKFAQRKPVTFYDEGSYGSISALLGIGKSRWDNGYGYDETKEEFERQIEQTFKELLPWEDRLIFDDNTVETLNWHFPLETLLTATRSSALPDYLRRSLVLTVWTRAILLKNESVAQRIALEVPRVAPEMTRVFATYLAAETKADRDRAALFVLLKFQKLSPVLAPGVPTFASTEDSSYYLEGSWWCAPSTTEYNDEGTEIAKVVDRPAFLTALEVEAARRERAALMNIGDAKRYLGQRVLEWARASPADERIPEALFIAVKANESYKYGCGGWEHDPETKSAAEAILREQYPASPWTAKLAAAEK